MTEPTRAAVLNYIAASEPLEKTLERFPGLTREQIRALLREAALLMHAEEQGAPDTEAPVRPALRAPAAEGAAAAQGRSPARPASRSGGEARTSGAASRSSESTSPKVTSAAGAADSPAVAEPPGGATPAESGARRLRLFSDGAARGNPGPAGAGAVLTRTDGKIVAKLGKFLGSQTNNYAEYSGLLLGLEAALRLGAEEIEVVADSELLVRQLQGAYKVKSATLKPLYESARGLLRRFRQVEVRHVPRAQNKLADEMSNRAIDERL